MNTFTMLKLYHGSPITDLLVLDVAFSDPQSPFGPGIYMSADLDVARSYSRWSGTIYSIHLAGEKRGVIDLDRTWAEQSFWVIAVGARLFKWAGIQRPKELWDANAREVLDAVNDKRARNVFLAKQGIWLIHGHLDSVIDGGRGDRGCQYLLLNTLKVTKISPYL
jgi:hypothetical protein